MASATMVTLTSPVGYYGNPIVARAQYGDDGPGNGPDPEVTVTVGSSDEGDAREAWGGTVAWDGTWCSGWHSASLTIAPYGTNQDLVTYTIDGSDVVSLLEPALGDLSSVWVVAGSQTNGYTGWSSLAVTFSNGTSTDTADMSGITYPYTDESYAATPGGEQYLVLDSSQSNNTSVTVSGEFEFCTPPGVSPNPADLFADFAVYTG